MNNVTFCGLFTDSTTNASTYINSTGGIGTYSDINLKNNLTILNGDK